MITLIDIDEEMTLHINLAQLYELQSPSGIIASAFVIPYNIDWEERPEFVEVCGLHVNNQFRRRGYGTLLFSRICKSYERSWICLEPKSFLNESGGMNGIQLKNWYRRFGLCDGTPYHEGGDWMGKAPFPNPTSGAKGMDIT